MTNEASTLVVDARGMRCPWPALRLARAMRDARDVLLIADDPQAGREIAALAGEHGWSVEDAAPVSDEQRWRVQRR
ncbi:MAG: sulfurtransferase TusA family protein [Sphingopyxis sp.]|nr:sulfurtransferase TusA family protein [Sphingopyxis sp.]